MYANIVPVWLSHPPAARGHARPRTRSNAPRLHAQDAKYQGRLTRYWGVDEPLVPLAQRLIIRVAAPFIRLSMIKGLKLGDAHRVDEAYRGIRALVDKVGPALADRVKAALALKLRRRTGGRCTGAHKVRLPLRRPPHLYRRDRCGYAQHPPSRAPATA
jgi:hypothetical protein